MSKRKKYIGYPKERAILSDVHPYELPITFSNRYLYRFIVSNNINLEGNIITYKDDFTDGDATSFKEILKILFHKDFNNKDDYKFRRIPFTYKITHKENDFRQLALLHPINQLNIINFYDQYKSSILYSCQISNFSLRRPIKVARFTFFNDKLHQQNKGDRNDFLELDGFEYEDLKTFFVYKKYNNIYKFYEDYRFHRAEKKFNFLFKFDINKCFDSIYTHSISWAVLGLDAVKENVEASKNNYSGIFDKLLQYANYGETNGILIGPEISRIFAEIILQRIDKDLEIEIINSLKLKNKEHYELYRYVDDYFLFCDDENTKNEILKILKHKLKDYKLAINNSKSIDYTKPIITDITIAKDKINKLFKENPRFKISELESEVGALEENDNEFKFIKHKFSFYFNSDHLITDYKILIKESNIDYKDVLNYSLALLNNIIERNLVSFEKVYFEYLSKIKSEDNQKNENDLYIIESEFTKHIVKFIDFIFFIYSVSPRVNSTIKICHILSKILSFYNLKEKKSNNKKFIFQTNNRHKVYKKILDESTLIIKKNKLNPYSQLEILYLLTLIKELGKDFRLPINIIEEFIGCEKIDDTKQIKYEHLNYFSITVLLYYLGDTLLYNDLKNMIINYTLSYIEKTPIEKRSKSSELTHLILDLLVCPYIEEVDKKKLFNKFKGFSEGGLDKEVGKLLIFFKKYKINYWFTKWKRFNLAKELEYKKSQEVYS